MPWYHLRHKKSGEGQFVGSLELIKVKDFEITELDEEPTHLHHFDHKSKKLVLNHGKKADHDRHVATEGLTKADMWDMILDLKQRVEALEARGQK